MKAMNKIMLTKTFIKRVLIEGRVVTRKYIYIARETYLGIYVKCIERVNYQFRLDNWEDVAYIDQYGVIHVYSRH